jgi:hypothetical protein
VTDRRALEACLEVGDDAEVTGSGLPS